MFYNIPYIKSIQKKKMVVVTPLFTEVAGTQRKTDSFDIQLQSGYYCLRKGIKQNKKQIEKTKEKISNERKKK